MKAPGAKRAVSMAVVVFATLLVGFSVRRYGALSGWSLLNMMSAIELLGDVERCAATGRAEGIEIEYWVGGGLPPPLHVSEQFRIRSMPGGDILEFSTPKYVRGHDPYPNDVYTMPVAPEDVKEVARLILDGRVFTAVYDEEADPKVEDGLEIEVIIKKGDKRILRRYFGRVPTELKPLEQFVGELVERTKARGEHTVRE